MNLQESIRRTLREEYNERQKKILTLASKVGFLKASEMFGGIKELLNTLGDEFLSVNNKIKIIQEIIDKLFRNYHIVSLKEIGVGKILLKNTGDIYIVIEYITSEGVGVIAYGGHYYEETVGHTSYLYEELSKGVLDDLFNRMLNYYIHNSENN